MALRLEVAVDANPLVSSLLGGAALEICLHDSFRLMTTERTTWEVKRYLPVISQRSGVAEEDVLLLFESLPVTAVQSSQYEASLPRARAQIAQRDPKDVDILALTCHLGCPLWTSDRDLLEVADKRTVETADLLALARRLGIG